MREIQERLCHKGVRTSSRDMQGWATPTSEGEGWESLACGRGYIVNVGGSLLNDAAALSPGPEMPHGEGVAEWPVGQGRGQAEGPGHPMVAQAALLCGL